MTKPEAQVLEAKLTRIWTPLTSKYQYSDMFRTFEYQATLASNITLWVSNDNDELSIQLSRIKVSPTSRPTLDYIDVWLAANSSVGILDGHDTEDEKSTVECFRADWLPLFSRGCWLSGIPIEASAHEKAEWIRGFTREEIEAWNLKM